MLPIHNRRKTWIKSCADARQRWPDKGETGKQTKEWNWKERCERENILWQCVVWHARLILATRPSYVLHVCRIYVWGAIAAEGKSNNAEMVFRYAAMPHRASRQTLGLISPSSHSFPDCASSTSKVYVIKSKACVPFRFLRQGIKF